MIVVLDTNHFRELQIGTLAGKRLRANLDARGLEVCTSTISAEESIRGWFALISSKSSGLEQVEAYARFDACLRSLAKLNVLPFHIEAAQQFHHLVTLRLRVGTMDLKIAAICIAHGAMLLTRNLTDFERVPGLRAENWLD